MVQYLIEQGADIHAENDSALVSATMDDHVEMIRYLIGLGANTEVLRNYTKWRGDEADPAVYDLLVELGVRI